MHNKKKIIKKIAELLDKLNYVELSAIYEAICKFQKTQTL